MPEQSAIDNVPEFSVGELSGALRQTVEDAFGRVRVRGEVSGFKAASSGHLYFALKDADAVLDAACFKQHSRKLAITPEDGLEVIATGRLTTYAQRSKYQLIVEGVEAAGKGALLALIEARRKALAAEGLFDSARKKPLPFLPAVIGVVTSPTGAVVRDILHRLADRCPRRVLVWPVLVQGQGAAEQVAAAIAGFDAIRPGGPVPRPDLVIVARGGGSVEDLMAFNEEVVVRAAAACGIPLISAVGHETDTTLIDFAADRRAPTPTAAAEMAVPVRAEVLARLLGLGDRMTSLAAGRVERGRLGLDGLRRGLGDPTRLVEAAAQRLDDRAERLGQAAIAQLARLAGRVAVLGARLPSPHAQVARAATRLEGLARALDAGLRVRVDRERVEGARYRDRLGALGDRLSRAAAGSIAVRGVALEAAGRTLEAMSYRNTLDRGFAVVRAAGRPVSSAADLGPGREIEIELADGRAKAMTAGAKPAKAAARPAGQGTLF
jgi:exodeoxyribonuclease VII large subunit